MVVDAPVHQVAHHEVVLHGHEPLGLQGELAVGGEGQAGEDALEVEHPIARAGVVAVAQEVIEAIAVELAADQRLDRRIAIAAVLEQVRHVICGPWRKGLERLPQRGVLADEAAGPALMVQPIHLFAGVAEGAMADVVQQGCGVEHPPMLVQF